MIYINLWKAYVNECSPQPMASFPRFGHGVVASDDVTSWLLGLWRCYVLFGKHSTFDHFLLDASQSSDQRTQQFRDMLKIRMSVCLEDCDIPSAPLISLEGFLMGSKLQICWDHPVGASWSSKFFSLLCWWGPSNQYGPQSFWMDLTIGERSRNSIKLREMANKTHLTSWRRKEHHGPSAGLWITYTYLCIYIYNM